MDQLGWRTRRLEREIRPAFRKATESVGWQCIEVPAAGRWTLRLEYDARDVVTGLVISTDRVDSAGCAVMLRAGFEMRRGAARSDAKQDGGVT